MRIINLDKGEAYELKPDAKMEVERTNPFFNDYAEATVPMDIPASPRNCRLLGFPDLFGGRVKMVSSTVSIQDGEYCAHCRQVVLSATRKGNIQTSFCINDGSFYAKLQNIKLRDVFGKPEDVIEFESMAAAIQFCRELRNNQDPRFSIFPVLVTDDSGTDRGFNYKILNAFGAKSRLTQDESVFNPDMMDGTGCDFYNARDRTEVVNEVPISLTPGYYISPFIRAVFVLERIFSHLGYTLDRNFFSQTEPFSSMVLLNNIIDTIVNKKIYVSDLVPDIGVADMLATFRKKFCCEFSINEINKTASVVFLKDLKDATPYADLTDRVTAEPTISYKAAKEFNRIVLKATKTLDGEVDESYDDLSDMVKSSPLAYFEEKTGCFVKDGFSGDFRMTVKLSESSQPYDTGESLEAKEIKVPECIPEFRTLKYTYFDDNDDAQEVIIGNFLYVGDYQTVNSKMVVSGEDDQESEDDGENMMPMLAFSAFYSGRAVGTVTSTVWGPPVITSAHVAARDSYHFCNYALVYNGTEGIFERFYRPYDLLLRNSMQEMKVKLMLRQSEKQDIPAFAKIVIRGVSFFLNKLKFTLGGKTEPVESQLLTADIYHDQDTGAVNEAPSLGDILPTMASEYKWVGRRTDEEISSSVWYDSLLTPDHDRTFETRFPPVPGPEWVGQRWGEQVCITRYQTRHSTFFRSAKYEYTRITVWLECVHK